jgi:signal transduction histidine kinase
LGQEVALRILDERGDVAYPKDPDARALTPDGSPFEPRLEAFALTRAGVAQHAATAPLDHGGKRWYVQLAISDRLVLQMRRSVGFPALTRGVAATCALFLVIFLITTHVTLRMALAPLRAASEAARRIAPRTLDARLDVAAQPSEIRPLIEAFNQALDRLEHGYRTQQEFLASAAHELKTPLALIRAQIELGSGSAHRDAVLRDVDLMGRQVQQLLLLAEVSEPQSFRIEPGDPRPVVREVFEFIARVAERQGVYLANRIAADIKHWHADRGALFTLLKNLLENAIQHSPAGGIVTLDVTATGFSVVDQGPGVSADDLPHIFERFWRGRSRRHDGAGLGLAICKEITTAHGWDLTARCPGKGFQVTVVTGRHGSRAPKTHTSFTPRSESRDHDRARTAS